MSGGNRSWWMPPLGISVALNSAALAAGQERQSPGDVVVRLLQGCARGLPLEAPVHELVGAALASLVVQEALQELPVLLLDEPAPLTALLLHLRQLQGSLELRLLRDLRDRDPREHVEGWGWRGHTDLIPPELRVGFHEVRVERLEADRGQPPLPHLGDAEVRVAVVLRQRVLEAEPRSPPLVSRLRELGVEERGLAHLDQTPRAGVEPAQQGVPAPERAGQVGVGVRHVGQAQEELLVAELAELEEGPTLDELLPRQLAGRARRRRVAELHARLLQDGAERLREDEQRAHQGGVRRAGRILVVRPRGRRAHRRRQDARDRDPVQGCQVRGLA
mmetsp:Transcript_33606/g.99776  ORF Transcript_33606/g.99776 Transcript_33606/m.99776 type:complete len:333 (+) Transcript_33606:3-1001(+)